VRQAERLVGSQISRQTGQKNIFKKQIQTDRHRQTGRQADRQVAIYAAGSRKGDRVAGQQYDREASRQEAMQHEGRQSGRQADGLVGRQEGRQSGSRQADGLVGRPADGRQKGRLADITYTFVQLPALRCFIFAT
jgi:hypothetical protein